MSALKTTLVLSVHGPAFAEGTISVDDLVALLRPVQSAVERAALVLRGEAAVRPGRRPRAVEEATRLRLVAVRAGSVRLELQVDQKQLQLLGPHLGQEAARVVVEGLATMPERDTMPRGWDPGVVCAIRELGVLFLRGAERIEIALESDGEKRVVPLLADRLEQLTRWVTGPIKDRHTVEGRLLMANFAEWVRRCRVYPLFGPPVECVFDEALARAVLDALTRYVRVTGEAEYDRASGRIKQLRVADLQILDEQDRFPEQEHPFWEPVDLEQLSALRGVQPIGSPEDLRADIWESEEELEEFLAEVYTSRSREPGE